MEQKDVDARWTKKNGKSYYGYKDHIKADEKSKLIDSYSVTDASVHDSQETENLLEDENKGQGLSSGIYLYNFNAVSINGKQNFQATKKMILIK